MCIIDKNKMPKEKPAWKMTAEEFAEIPPSYEWFKWLNWPEGFLYCRNTKYALKCGFQCCLNAAVNAGIISKN